MTFPNAGRRLFLTAALLLLVHHGFAGDVDALRRAAESGDAEAQFELGRIYASGDGVEPDAAKAAECFRMAAEQGDPLAQHSLGSLYLLGDGVPQNNETGVDWIGKAAEQGFPQSECVLGLLCVSGKIVPRDVERGIALLESAGEKGNIDALTFLFSAYRDGDQVEADPDQAFYWLGRMAEEGLPEAQLEVGRTFYLGDLNQEQSFAKAAEWYRKAADGENAEAQLRLTAMMFDGVGMAKDFIAGYRMWIRSMESGSQDAVDLWMELMYGDDPAVEENFGAVRDNILTLQAADEGDPESQMKMAALCANGVNTAVDFDAAAEWLELAAEGGLAAAKEALPALREAKATGVVPEALRTAE